MSKGYFVFCDRPIKNDNSTLVREFFTHDCQWVIATKNQISFKTLALAREHAEKNARVGYRHLTRVMGPRGGVYKLRRVNHDQTRR